MTHPSLTTLSEDEVMLRDMVARFAKEQIGPRVSSMDHQSKIDPELLQSIFDLGLMGIEVPSEYGGGGMSFFAAILVIEELAKVDPSISVCVDVQNTLVNNAIVNWGTEEQKRTLFGKMTRDTVASYCLSEPASGSDAFALQTRATKDGDDYVINGSKLWITNGGEAGVYIVFANINPDVGYKGITAFILESGMPGFTVGKKEDKLGIRASSTVDLYFENVRVPKENVLGEVGKGYKIAIETLNEGRIGIGAQMIGLAQGAFDNAMAYMLERKQFGRRIADFPRRSVPVRPARD
jgi:alkylation response protein AidB-like acyl-CoA dehydrogenase